MDETDPAYRTDGVGAFGSAAGPAAVSLSENVTDIGRRVCKNDPSNVQEEIIPVYEDDEEGNPAPAVMEWFERVTDRLRGLIDRFLRLFRR